MLNRGIEKDIVPLAIENNIGIIAYSPLERGLLSGKYFKGEKLKSDDHRQDYFGQFNPEKVEAFLKKIEPLAEEKKASLAQLVLKWTTLQPGITVVLAGARNKEQAISNAKAIEVNLTEKEVQYINNELAQLSL